MRGVLLGAALAPVGALSALPALVLHQHPVALALAVVGSTAAVLALPRGWPRSGYAAGWLSLLGLALSWSPGGDVLVPATASGYALLLAGLVLVVLALVTLPPPRRGRGRPRQPAESDPRDDHGSVGRSA